MRISTLLQAITLSLLFFNAGNATPPEPLRDGSPIYVEQMIEPFPDIAFYDAEGNKHQLSDFNGTPRIVNFWATWCTPCIREMPHFQALQRKFGEKLKIFLINEDRNGFDAITPFVAEHKLEDLASFHDKKNLEFRKLMMKGLPMSFLLDAEGNLIATVQGEVDWLSEDIKRLMNLKEIDVQE